jgi:hypothetical protein
MNNQPLDVDSLRRLLMEALDGEASDDQLDELNQVLRDDAAARRTVVEFLRDEALLSEEIGTLDDALAVIRQAVGSRPTASDLPSILGNASNSLSGAAASRPFGAAAPKRSRGGSIVSRLRRAADYVNNHGLAVSLLSLAIGASFYWHYSTILAKFDELYSQAVVNSKEAGGDALGPRFASPRAVPVARVTGANDCVWQAGERARGFGDTLFRGDRVRLKSGTVQLTYETGTKVVVEGPVDMVMSTGVEAKLASGKIAAAVPRFARGYTIVTPTAEVVDLGTEFGVSVDENGTSEVHVFDGDVVTRRAGLHGFGAIVHAKQDEAVEIDGQADGPRPIEFDAKKFVRRLIPDVPAEKLPPLPVKKNLSLWLAADVMTPMKSGEPVSTWPDILVGDNRFPDDAWQFDARLCPVWVRDGEGRPAVRFDGWSTSMATSPMETGNQQTTFVVASPSPASFASESHGGILVKHGLNSPALELTVLPNHKPRGLVWAADSVGVPSNVGIIEGRPIAPLAPSVISYLYDGAADRSELAVNGAVQGTSTAPRSLEQNAKIYIGSHAQPSYEAFFLGNIYEIIIYDSALSNSDRDLVFTYLSSRYGIALGR